MAPASSRRFANPTLRASSKDAFSSIRTATCLPAAAAISSARTIGLAELVRYSVDLMASTAGSGTKARRGGGRGRRVSQPGSPPPAESGPPAPRAAASTNSWVLVAKLL